MYAYSPAYTQKHTLRHLCWTKLEHAGFSAHYACTYEHTLHTEKGVIYEYTAPVCMIYPAKAALCT